MDQTLCRSILIYWPSEQTVGKTVNLTHEAATPPGLIVTGIVKSESVEGRKLTFSSIAADGVDKISEGTRERFITSAPKFNRKMNARGLNGASQLSVILLK